MKVADRSWFWGWHRGLSVAINGYDGQWVTQWTVSFAAWDWCLGIFVAIQKRGVSQALRETARGARDGQ
jgi:hypothetical protein